MAFGQHTLKFLHLSDLHLRGPREKEPWRRRRVLGEAWQRNLETLLNEEGAIDFVFFTGDAAQSGQPDEFDEATTFLTALCSELSLNPSRLFVVPGNHDIDRTIAPAAWEKLRMSLAASSDMLAVSRWMNGIDRRPPFGFDDGWKNAVLDRQRPYRDWLKHKLHRPELTPEGLGYRASFNLPGWAQSIHIVGLDTGWLCGDDADKGRLLLTENQAANHLTTPSGEPLSGLRIVLLHHPLSELADASSAKRLLATHADLVLRGHLHETEVVEWLEPDRRLRELAAGSLYEGGLADTYGNSCHFVRLDLDSQLRPIEALVRFRSFLRVVATGSTTTASIAKTRTAGSPGSSTPLKSCFSSTALINDRYSLRKSREPWRSGQVLRALCRRSHIDEPRRGTLERGRHRHARKCRPAHR
jgi:predicted phosphodiesterase